MNVIIKVLGGEVQEKSFSTVGEARAALGLPNHTATVNGIPKDDSYSFRADNELLAFAPAVKGGK